MNLNISYNWLKEYFKTTETAAEFAKKISLSGPSVDHITEIKPNFDQVVVGQILKIEQHPNADKLHVCQVEIGAKQPLTIVCGAPNIKEGQKVPVVLVGGKVGDFEIKAAKLRGVDSEGMMCSQKELGLGEDHAGIYILPDYTEVGLALEKVMPISDFIFDMEVTSNRPDAMSIIGIAREAAAIMGGKFLYHEPKPNLTVSGDKLKLSVTVKEPKLCPRYQAIVMKDVKVAPSPLWMQQRLLASGLRPINNLVDITNYILLEFGQPMHVFDYDKLGGQEIVVRLAQKGEKILALDGKEYELDNSVLVVADSKKPCVVAGIMGGELSGASDTTQNVVLEVGNWENVNIRKTARALNLHSDSSNLYEKGLSPEGTEPALMRAIELVAELANGRVASEIIDEKAAKHKTKEIKLKLENIKRILGVDIKPAQVKKSLENLGFEVAGKTGDFMVTVPWWRDRDVEGEHDLAEEVARIYGYYNLPTKLMAGDLPENFSAANDFYWEDKIKDILAGFGLTETYTYSFASEKIIKNCSLNLEDHIKLANPLSIDFEYLRSSILPGLLQTVADNAGFFNEMKLFELSRVFVPQKDNLPLESSELVLVFSGSDGETALANLKGVIDGLRQRLNLLEFDFEWADSETSVWSQSTAKVILSGEQIGWLGLINSKTLGNFGIKKVIAATTINVAKLIKEAKGSPAYQPISKYPAIELDLSMEIDQAIPFAKVVETAKKINNELIKNVSFLSVYQGDKIGEGKKALAIRVTYRHDDRTLELKDAQSTHEKVVEKLKQEYNIRVR
ncbi:MAG: phenylalanine--tRNA ligase subunit beta [Patescibacteria group bacterium]